MKPIKDKLYWLFPKDTVPNSLIQDTLTQLQNKDKQAGRVGKGSSDEMRQVQKVPMDEFDPLSVLLYGYARKANDLVWNYDLVGPCQFEMLYYENQGDKYDFHVDTLWFDNGLCRKLTVLSFMNEDYEGGDLMIKTDDRETNIIKLDTPKGGIVVFPTFLMHAVKPILSGKRISCVGWITGPMLK